VAFTSSPVVVNSSGFCRVYDSFIATSRNQPLASSR